MEHTGVLEGLKLFGLSSCNSDTNSMAGRATATSEIVCGMTRAKRLRWPRNAAGVGDVPISQLLSTCTTMLLHETNHNEGYGSLSRAR